MLIAQPLVLAILGDSQMAADAHRPGFDFAQEDVNLAGFQLGRMAQGLHGSYLAGHDAPSHRFPSRDRFASSRP